jgi:two-component sensor histidine kinase
VLAAVAIRAVLLGPHPGYPYLTAFPAVIAAGLVFDRGSAFLAVLLSALLGVLLFVAPLGSLYIPDPVDAVAMVLFTITGLFIAVLIEDLRVTVVGLIEANRQLAQAEAQQEALLREAAHRWHNDLQRLLATLRLQAQASLDERVRAALADAAERVQALARVNRRFERHRHGAAVVDTQELLIELVEDLRQAAGAELRPIAFTVTAKAHELPRDQAALLGLITTELVGNALKYAFPDGRAGAISVDFRREGDRFVLTVADDGVGFDPAAPPRGTGLGRTLVHGFAAQLGGQAEVRLGTAEGTRCIVSFPAPLVGGRGTAASTHLGPMGSVMATPAARQA